jgi:hypothetical protein
MTTAEANASSAPAEPTPALHRLYFHYSELPFSLRWLYTCVLVMLGIGYIFALIYVLHTYGGRAGGRAHVLTYQDLVVAYSGNGQASRLESALRGPMKSMLPADETTTILSWVQRGADAKEFADKVQPILTQRCMACHDGRNPHMANLSSFESVRKLTDVDRGADVFTLVRVSHIHLFGLSFVFFILGTIFSHAYVRPVWLKCAIVITPFVSLALDVSSWYFTKLYPPFAWAVIFGGGMMALSFAAMWLISMYQMWVAQVPAPVAGRPEPLRASVG